MSEHECTNISSTLKFSILQLCSSVQLVSGSSALGGMLNSPNETQINIDTHVFELFVLAEACVKPQTCPEKPSALSPQTFASRLLFITPLLYNGNLEQVRSSVVLCSYSPLHNR